MDLPRISFPAICYVPRFSRRSLAAVSVALFAIIALQWGAQHNVPTALTLQDRLVIEHVLPGVPDEQAIGASFVDQVRLIRKFQRAVLRMAPKNSGIPLGLTREPADLERHGGGLCYDRSRSIEKFLEFAGFQTRHVSLYSTAQTGSALVSLLTPGTPSHAMSEVKTVRGWLAVGSVTDWLALDRSGNPVTAAAIAQAIAQHRPIQFLQRPPVPFLNAPFVAVYGLYSRQGEFYPPFDRVPNVNFQELLANL